MKKDKLVYSTRTGNRRKPAGGPAGLSRSLPPARHNLRIRRETKGRGGKTVTVITGFALTGPDLKALAKTLKNLCGSGGTVKIEGDAQSIEIQGDHRERVLEKLTGLGYPAKLAGG